MLTSVERPGLARDGLQQPRIGAGVHAVNGVITAHQAADPAFLHARLKGRQVCNSDAFWISETDIATNRESITILQLSTRSCIVTLAEKSCRVWLTPASVLASTELAS